MILTLGDYSKIIDSEELEDVVGDLSMAGWELLQDLEGDAIDEMKGYLAVRYDAEKSLDDAENASIGVLKRKLVDMILYDAFALIVPNNIPELRTTRRDNAIEYLEKIADGFINPAFPILEDEATTPLRFGSELPKSDNYF